MALFRCGTSTAKVVSLGTGKTFNVKNLLVAQGIVKPDSYFQNLTIDDFMMFGFPTKTLHNSDNQNPSIELLKSYDTSNFTLTMQLHSRYRVHEGGGVYSYHDIYGDVNACMLVRS